jgi:hypothetical protein
MAIEKESFIVVMADSKLCEILLRRRKMDLSGYAGRDVDEFNLIEEEFGPTVGYVPHEKTTWAAVHPSGAV